MLIGRDAERRMIEGLVAGARNGQGGVLVITGEPGIGKTTLLDHAATSAAGMKVLRAAGSEPEREVPFGALHQVLRPMLDRIDEIPAPQAQALSAALALRPGTTGDRFAVGAATLSLLCRFAEDQPLAILLDDLPLFDRPSAAALTFAARRLVADPIVLLATARTAEARDQLPQLPLAGVDLAAAGELVSRHSPVPVSTERVARLHLATAGNPLALVELAGAAADASPAAPLPVPAALADAFAARARGLGRHGRAALTVAAVVGTDLRVIGRACQSLGVDVEELADAEDAELIRIGDGRVEFRHPLIRAAVYGDAAPEHRRAVHRAVADALGPQDADRHAWHLAEATIGPDSGVSKRLTEAAERADARSAHDIAATAFARAARLCPDTDQHARLCVAAAESAWLAGAASHATALLDEAGELTVPEVRLQALELRGAIATRTGSLAVSRDTLLAAAALTPTADCRVILLADAISACFYLCDTATAVDLAGEIETLLDGVTTPKARGLGQIAAGVALVMANRGGTSQLRAGVDLLTASGGLRDDQRRRAWLMTGPLYLRDSTSGDELRRIVRDTRADTAVGSLPSVLFHVARDEATTNQWVRAEATYDEAIRLARETGQNTELAMSLAGLAWLCARLGREPQCRTLVAEALPICQAREIHIGRIWSLFALGELELGLGDPRKALAHFDELDALLDTLGVTDPDLSPAPERADALLRLGMRAEAEPIAHRYRDAAATKNQPWALARAERVLGMLGTDSHFATALDFHARTLDDFETARTRLAHGASLRRARQRVAARPQLRAALATFEELGAVPWADLTAIELAATGETIRRRAPSGVQTLTPQELQVGLLLSEGRTTREVAAALFLSPKTVEYHLRKVYAKLDIRSRAELTTQLAT